MCTGQGRASARPQGLALTRALEPLRFMPRVNAMRRLAFTPGSFLRPFLDLQTFPSTYRCCTSVLKPPRSVILRPNVEVTGATREASQAVRPMMNYGGRTAWLACRGASG